METTVTQGYAIHPVKISTETKRTLDVLKIHPRETYDDVLRRLIEIARRAAAAQESGQ